MSPKKDETEGSFSKGGGMHHVQQEIFIVTSEGHPPAQELNAKLRELGNEWHIDSATTSIAAVGDRDDRMDRDLYYVTTVVMSRAAKR